MSWHTPTPVLHGFLCHLKYFLSSGGRGGRDNPCHLSIPWASSLLFSIIKHDLLNLIISRLLIFAYFLPKRPKQNVKNAIPVYVPFHMFNDILMLLCKLLENNINLKFSKYKFLIIGFRKHEKRSKKGQKTWMVTFLATKCNYNIAYH